MDASGEPSPFLTPSWMKTWVHRRGAVEARGLVWEDGNGTPVACALLPSTVSRVAFVPVRQTFLNATGGLSVASEHNTLLALPQYRAEAVRDLVRYLTDPQATEEFLLEGASADSYRLFEEAWPERLVECYRSESPYVDMATLRREGREYLSALSSNTRSQVRRSIRLYEEAFGAPRYERAENPAQRIAWLEELADQHERYWREKGDDGAFSEGRLDFHRALVEATAAAGDDDLSIELSRLTFGARTVGWLYHLLYRGRACFYQSAFRYDDDPRLKPGLVTHAFAVERFKDRGLDEYDFLGGERRPVRYKRSLSTDRRTLVWARFRVPSAKMSALQVVRRARRRVSETGLLPDTEAGPPADDSG